MNEIMQPSSSPDVTVRGNAAGFVQDIEAGNHKFRADEPISYGGSDVGPGPYRSTSGRARLMHVDDRRLVCALEKNPA